MRKLAVLATRALTMPLELRAELRLLENWSSLQLCGRVGKGANAKVSATCAVPAHASAAKQLACLGLGNHCGSKVELKGAEELELTLSLEPQPCRPHCHCRV